ncbi:MAG: hypothetical protein E7182_03415 [Erysipelotrichaceae bacterium]|nr:hypothetical protein [Erysipelotrichaceae bacterium]
MRAVKAPETHKGESLFRTMAISLIIGGFIGFAAMFWPLHQNRPAGADASYYLPWCLSYGITNLTMAVFGVIGTTLSKEKPGLYKPGDIVGIVCGAILFAEAIPQVIFFHNVEFMISMMVIGACVVVIAALGLASLKEDQR